MSLTAKYRKASGVKYPNAYASNELAEKDVNAYTFNCGKPPTCLILFLFTLG